MTSLSKVLKSPYVTADNQVKLIESNAAISHPSSQETISRDEVSPELMDEANQIIVDAGALAEKQLQTAKAQIDLMQQEAKQEIESWWGIRRQEDEAIIETHRVQGYTAGYEQGLAAGKEQAFVELMSQLELAKEVLNGAYETKLNIINEAEPFLVELSTAIARKILEQDLKCHPELVLDMVGKALSRIRGQHSIALSVHPNQFAIVQASREELLRFIDREAELKIFPDPTVEIGGCLIRNSLGTIDARVDTQLEEIKKGLLEMVGSTDEVAE
jgi:flagellar assembly protein FliH